MHGPWWAPGRIGLVALAGAAVWVLLGVPFLVRPTIDPVPAHADVAVALGPPVAQRVAETERLLDDGTVDAALVSVPYDAVPGSLIALCSRPHVVCADPSPRTTRGEARLLARYAAEEGWRSAVVVTMPAHVSRARTIVERCFAGRVSMVATDEAPFGGWPYQYAYQTAATVKAWILQGC